MIVASLSRPQTDLLTEIERALAKDVYPVFRAWANELLDARIAGPNKGDPYTVNVDGQPVSDRRGINHATRKVVVRFIQATIDLAVAILAQELRSSIIAAASPMKSIKREEIARNVLLFYNGNRISDSAKITEFSPGDYIMVVPSYITQAYGNTKKYGAQGYMGRAARRLRTKLRINKRDSGLTLFAGRSRAAWEAIVDANGNHMTPPGGSRGFWGAWALTLRYKKRNILLGGA